MSRGRRTAPAPGQATGQVARAPAREKRMIDESPTPRRRGLLKAAAVGAVGTAVLAKPNVSRAQTTVLRFQSTWPQRDIFHEFAQDYVTRVNAMAGGRLRLELLAAGAVVGAFQLLDAVSSGTLDGGHGVPAYWFGKNKAFSLFGKIGRAHV